MSRQFVSGPTWIQALSLILLLTIPAMAAAFDQVGIYFDESYNNYTISAPQANTIVTGYLVLNDPNNGSGVAGWELCADIEGPGMFLSWDLAGQTINIETAPCFQVGVGDAPLPGTTRILLATFTLLVQEPLPIAITVNPIYHASFPGEMAYLTNDDPSEIRVLSSASGEPAVAWINHDLPGAEVEPPHVFFEDVALFNQATRIVSVHNPGGGSLIMDIELVGDSEFHLPSVFGPTTVNGGETLEIPVSFTPTEVTLFTASLVFNNSLAPNVMVRGYGRDPIEAWDVAPDLVFDEIPVGTNVVRDLLVTNIGETTFPVEASLNAECTEFSILNPGPYTLEPGESIAIYVQFAPEIEGLVSCQLNLGPVVDPVLLFGTGHVVLMDYSVSPDNLVFPDLAVGNTVSRNISLSNTGEGPLYLDIELAESSDEFLMVSGAGPRVLQPGNGMYITIEFTPTAIGEFSNAVTFGNDLIPQVPVSGAGIETFSTCIVTPEYLNFGPMVHGGYYTQHVSVFNNGNTELFIDAEPDCGSTTVVPSQATIAPGETQQLAVSHHALYQGPWQCLITLGDDACSDVTCTGVVNSAPPPGESLVGLFFDDYFYENFVEMPDAGIVDAHLVLFNSMDQGGVSGWECRLEIVGEMCQLVGSEIFGDFINVGDSPNFQVGLGTPMPWAEVMHLADFNLFLLEPYYEAFLLLVPITTPSIPGEMAFLGGDSQEIFPMYSATGTPEVASINGGGYVAVQAPAPEVAMLGNLVELNWDVQDHSDKSFMVYRRGETGMAESLFSQPRSAENGHFVYHDNPAGFADGTVLHYSYAVLQDGAEVARSPETDIVLSGLPVAATRLLPNVPNPFNPMTKINFEMEKAGRARVSIYDVSGRLVQTLVNEQLGSGLHVRVWQGRDATGRQVPSGAYYLRMETGGKVDHRKIMLLK